MNATEILNYWGTRFVNFALPMLAQSSLLIVVLYGLDRLLRRRVRAVVRHALWMLILVKLLLPPSVASPTGLAYWLPIRQASGSRAQVPIREVVRHTEAQVDSSMLSTPKQTHLAGPWLSWPALILIGWAIGAVGLFGWLIRCSRYVGRQVKAATDASGELFALLKQCGEQMQLRRTPRLKLTHSSMSPAVCGFGRPVILISRHLAESLSVTQLRAVLLHELAHMKRGDIWVNHAQTLLQIFYWWHPLLWLANARIRSIREQAVDETVMVQMGKEDGSYASTLLEVAKLALRRPLLALGLIGIVESSSELAGRIRHLIDRPAPETAKLSLASLAAIIIAGALLVPMAQGQRRDTNSARAGQINDKVQSNIEVKPAGSTSDKGATNQLVMIEAKFIALPHRAGAERMNPPTLLVSKGEKASTFLDADGARAVLAWYASQGIEPFASPRVTALSGHEAELSVSKAEVQDGKAVPVGVALRVVANVESNSVNLQLRLRMGNLSESTSPSASNPPADLFDPSRRFVLSTNVTVPNGKTAILGSRAVNRNSGTNYVILVTPKLVDPAKLPGNP